MCGPLLGPRMWVPYEPHLKDEDPQGPEVAQAAPRVAGLGAASSMLPLLEGGKGTGYETVIPGGVF